MEVAKALTVRSEDVKVKESENGIEMIVRFPTVVKITGGPVFVMAAGRPNP